MITRRYAGVCFWRGGAFKVRVLRRFLAFFVFFPTTDNPCCSLLWLHLAQRDENLCKPHRTFVGAAVTLSRRIFWSFATSQSELHEVRSAHHNVNDVCSTQVYSRVVVSLDERRASANSFKDVAQHWSHVLC